MIALGIIAYLLFRLVKRKKAREATQHDFSVGGGYHASSYPEVPAPKYWEAAVAQELYGGQVAVEAANNYHGTGRR